MNLVARNNNSQRSFIMLAPASPGSTAFHSVAANPERYSDLLTQTQRLRGRIYLNDGAIQECDLTPDGRHVSEVDKLSWHLLTITPDRKVMGCARFHKHPLSAPFCKLSVSHSSLARSAEYGAALEAAVESEMTLARDQGLSWLEMGGWALAQELRGTTEALMYALATFAWSQLIGGAIGISTVTERNGSSSILRRLGGQSLQWAGSPLPPYYDEQYRCTMDLLRFDSRFPAAKYAASIESLRLQIAETQVYCPENVSEARPRMPVAQMPRPDQSWAISRSFLALPSALPIPGYDLRPSHGSLPRV